MIFSIKLSFFICSFIFFVSNDRVFGHSVSEEIECHSCDSRKDANCIDANFTSIESSKLCKSALGICYTNIVDGELVRGCVGDSLFPDTQSIEKCYSGLRCSICKEQKCNSVSPRDTCIRCSSSDPDSECRKDPTLDLKGVCSLSEKLALGCYLNVTGETYTRGCIKDISFEDRTMCLDNSKTCKSCNTPNCNQKADFEMNCHYCNGDDNCAQAEDMGEITCNNYDKTCVTGIDPLGFTHRDCAHDTHFEKVEKCYTHMCNGQIYPRDRIQCYQCEGEYSCHDLIDGEEVLKPKPCKYIEDKCFAYLGKDDTFYRGCLKDNSDGRSKCKANKAFCKVCSESGCNLQKTDDFLNSGVVNQSQIILAVVLIAFLQFL